MYALFPSLYNPQIDRSPPRSAKEADQQAGSLFKRFQDLGARSHPVFLGIFNRGVAVNNFIVDVRDSYPTVTKVVIGGTLGLLTCAVVPVLGTVAKIAIVTVGVFSIPPVLARTMEARAPVLGAYHRELNFLVQETKALCEGDGVATLRVLAQLNNKIFRTCIVKSLESDLRSSVLSRRFIYKICWEGKVKAILVGTVHAHSRAVALDPILHEIVTRCRCVISELGLRDVVGLLNRGGLSYMMDGELILTALRHGIPVEHLETISQQNRTLEKFRKQCQEGSIELNSPELLGIVQELHALQENEQRLILQMSYVSGDSRQTALLLTSPPAAHKVLITDRNQEWLHGAPHLIARLKAGNTTPNVRPRQRVFVASDRQGVPISERHLSADQDKPIGIVVGLAHCLGVDGLVLRLKTEGFTVTKMENGW